MTPNIDHRQHFNPVGVSSLGISANTVCPPSASRPVRLATKDEAVATGRRWRYQLQRGAQGLLPWERVAHCQRSTMSASGVGVFRTAAGGASFSNLATCGSMWHCPVCAAKITEVRRQELQAAITAWALKGGEVYLATQTFPHLNHQPIAANLEKFSAAQKKYKQSKPYLRIMKLAGCVGSIVAKEVTHGANGWHPHTHTRLFSPARASWNCCASWIWRGSKR